MTNPYIQILRIDHWFKNLFIFVGTAFALLATGSELSRLSILELFVAFLFSCLISSSNYIINQITDEKQDSQHPEKRLRPIPSKKISKELSLFLAVLMFLVVFVFSAAWFEYEFLLSISLLWLAGFVYNVKPVRLKDRAYLDVISESVNNPIRFAIGWTVITIAVAPPASLLLATWSAGGILMTAKRYDELNYFGKDSAKYRDTFGRYSETILSRMIWIYSILTLTLWGIYLSGLQGNYMLAFAVTATTLYALIKRILSGKSEARNIEKVLLSRFFVGFIVLNTVFYFVTFVRL